MKMKQILIIALISVLGSQVYAQVKISQLDLATSVLDNNYFPIVDPNEASTADRNKRMTFSKLSDRFFEYADTVSVLATKYYVDDLITGGSIVSSGGFPLDDTHLVAFTTDENVIGTNSNIYFTKSRGNQVYKGIGLNTGFGMKRNLTGYSDEIIFDTQQTFNYLYDDGQQSEFCQVFWRYYTGVSSTSLFLELTPSTGTFDHHGYPVIGIGELGLIEKSADPVDPVDGNSSIWMSNGTGSGDDGDIMVKITAGGVTKTITLIDFSAF